MITLLTSFLWGAFCGAVSTMILAACMLAAKRKAPKPETAGHVQSPLIPERRYLAPEETQSHLFQCESSVVCDRRKR